MESWVTPLIMGICAVVLYIMGTRKTRIDFPPPIKPEPSNTKTDASDVNEALYAVDSAHQTRLEAVTDVVESDSPGKSAAELARERARDRENDSDEDTEPNNV